MTPVVRTARTLRQPLPSPPHPCLSEPALRTLYDTAAAHGAHEHDIDICACHVHAHVHVSTQDETGEQLQPHLAEAEHQRKHAAKKRARGGATVAVSARPSKRGRRVSKVERLSRV